MMGGLIMAHGDDRGLRAAAPPGADPGGGAARARRGRGRRRGRAARRRAGRGRGAGARSTPPPTSASAAGSPTGSCGACPCASRSGPATWPHGRRHASCAGTPARRRRCRSAGWRPRCRPCSSDIQGDLLAEATAVPGGQHRRRGHDRRGRRGGRGRLRPGAVGRAAGRRRRGPPARGGRHRAGPAPPRRQPARRARTSPTPSPSSPAPTDQRLDAGRTAPVAAPRGRRGRCGPPEGHLAALESRAS